MPKVQAASTQEHVQIASVREGVVIMKDGSYRLILSVLPINFSLKSEQEQNSLIFRYQSFLNSLHFPIQISMQSKKLDLTPYLQKIRKLVDTQQNELIRIQTEDYVDFIGQLINYANIMSKSFFVTINYAPISLPKTTFIDKLLGKQQSSNVLKISEADFKAHSEELLERGQQVARGLGSMGLIVKQLPTQEILEMFYNLYNPEEAGKERLIEIGELQSTVVVDKSEAQSAIASHTEEHGNETKIDNSAEVKKMSQQGGIATIDNPRNGQTNQPTDQPPKEQGTTATARSEQPADEIPPIKQRLSANPGAQTEESASIPAPAANNQPATTNNDQPTAPLNNDNYKIQ